jgi:sugar lactone lactonase YvrE
MVGRIRRSALGLISITFVFLAFVSGAFCQTDPNEPNGELGDATGINAGGDFGGSTSPAGDVDFYKFRIDSPGVLEVKLTTVPDDMKTRIDFYGKNFNWITRVDASNPGDLVALKLDITNPGWYYIGILDLAGKSHDLGYSFDLNFEPVVDYNEPNGEIGDATEINFGSSVDGYIFAGGDVDFYKFSVNSTGILDVVLESVPDDMKARIDFYGKNFNWITRVDASNPGDLVTLNLDIASPGWYYVGILDLAGKSHNVGYTFRAEFEPVVDENEPDAEIGDATEINFGDLVSGHIFPRADGDFYRFNVPSPGILEVKLTDSPDDMKTRIDFYGKNFNWITRVDASNPGDLVTLNLDIASPGWYYVGIVDLAGKSHNAEYGFSVAFEPVIDENEPNSEIGDATEINFGDLVTGIIFPKGDADFYKLWAGSGKLKVKLTDSPEDMKARIDLYGKNFNWITRIDASNPGDLATLEYEVANPGWYYIGITDLAGKSHNIGYSFLASGEGVGQSDIGGSTESKLSDLRGTLNTDSNCNLYVADYTDNQVKVVNPDGSATTYASGIDRPRYQKFDSAGNLYVGSFDGNIYKISPSGEKTVIASGIWSPQDMGFDGAGNLYVAGGYDGKIHRIAPDGSKTIIDSGFANPKHLAVRSDGNVYVVDSDGTSIVRITPEGSKASLVDLGETILGMATDGEYLYVSHSDKISRIDASGEVAPIATGLDQPSSLAVCDGNFFVTVKDGIVETKGGEIQGISNGTTTSYQEATLTHSGFDFSEGTTGEYPTYDGEIISWQSDLMATPHPNYPRDSDYLWWRNLHLDDVNHASQTKDMGAVDISTVRTVPADWDKSPLIPPLLVGHTIVAKCYDGYVKFQVISVDPVDWSARVRYSYSADAVFDDVAS